MCVVRLLRAYAAVLFQEGAHAGHASLGSQGASVLAGDLGLKVVDLLGDIALLATLIELLGNIMFAENVHLAHVRVHFPLVEDAAIVGSLAFVEDVVVVLRLAGENGALVLTIHLRHLVLPSPQVNFQRLIIVLPALRLLEVEVHQEFWLLEVVARRHEGLGRGVAGGVGVLKAELAGLGEG